MATRLAETRRRRREAASSTSYISTTSDTSARPTGQHYREMVQQLQREFERVVTALETRTTSLEQLNEELHHEVDVLRNELTTAKQRESEWEMLIQEAEEQAQMAREDTTSLRAAVANEKTEYQAQMTQLTLQLETQQKEWDAEREFRVSEYERVVKALDQATAQLAQEQQRNAQMSQEVQLLECRVDAAVKTSRSFELRLQQLKQLKKDEKTDLEAQVTHLKTRLEDKKEQNRYLAEALMDKETRRAVRKERETSRCTSDVSMSLNDATIEVRKRSTVNASPVATPMTRTKTSLPTTTTRTTVPTTTTKSTVSATTTKPKTSRYQLPEQIEEKKPSSHRYRYGGSALSEFLEDLQSQAPTSPTSSASPTRSPRSLASSTTTPTARTFRTTTASRLSPSPPPVTMTRTSSKVSTTTTAREGGRSDRTRREIERLRLKLEACQHMTTTESLSPH